MVAQHDEWGAVDEMQEHLLDADSIFGVQVVRDAEPSAHAVRLAEHADAEIIADLEHAERAFAARADAGRVEPVVLKTGERAELEERAEESNTADAADPDATLAELHPAADWSMNDDQPGAHPDLFDERALEHNRRVVAFSTGVAVSFAAGAVALALTGQPVFVALVVFVVGLIAATALARRKRIHLREEGGFDDVPQLTTDEELAGLGESVETPEDASRRLEAAQAWTDACETIDRPMVLVEPAAWLSDDELEALLNSLPAGAEVTIVEPS